MNEALQTGVLQVEDGDTVSADLYVGEDHFPIDLRLKGDWLEHLRGDKWSFRIKTKDGTKFEGMREFSIQAPETRNFMSEWLFHNMLRHEGLIGLRYDFVEVYINGERKGIYALEEHFGKELIENNSRREGPILKIDENFLWEERARETVRTGTYFDNAPIRAFNIKSILEDPTQSAEFERARILLKGYMNGELPVDEVFNVDGMAKFFAVTTLFNASHARIWHNMRFYYNPVTGLLEPIGFDAAGALNKPITTIMHTSEFDSTLTAAERSISALLISEASFYEKYIHYLEEMVIDGHLSDFLEGVQDQVDEEYLILNRDYPDLANNTNILIKNEEKVAEILSNDDYLLPFVSEYSSADHQITVQVRNQSPYPLELIGLDIKGDPEMHLERPIQVMPSETKEYVEISVPWFSGRKFELSDIESTEFIYKILGANSTAKSMGIPFSFKEDTEPVLLSSMGDLYTQYPFVSMSADGNTATLLSGEWKTEKSIVFPDNLTLIAQPGFSLDLNNNALFISRSTVVFEGTAADPIFFGSTDGTGGGVILMDTPGKNKFNYVVVSNMQAPQLAGFNLTGAVTIYESPIDIFNTLLIGNHSEDSLNIVRSKFLLDHVTIEDTLSDGFDVDFGIGTIRSSKFFQIGNDAVDFSGSSIIIEDLYVDGYGDKGISAGERSTVSVTNAVLKNGTLGVASKDESSTHIQNLTLEKMEIGLTVFQKKPEYGAAYLNVESVTMADSVKTPFELELGSQMIIDSKTISPNAQNLKERFYAQ